jgi:hypothetical protein
VSSNAFSVLEMGAKASSTHMDFILKVALIFFLSDWSVNRGKSIAAQCSLVAKKVALESQVVT